MATVFDGTTFIPVFGNDVSVSGIDCLVISVNYTDSPPLTEVRNGAGDTSMRVWSDTVKSKRLSLEVVPYGGSQALAATETGSIAAAGGAVTLASAYGQAGGISAWVVISKSVKASNSDVQSVSLELAPAL